MKPPATTTIKAVLFVAALMAFVCLPFAVWGESFALSLLQSGQNKSAALVLIAIVLLAADSVAPVPSSLVILFLAAKAGPLAGVVGGTIGMSTGVLTAAWLGRTAVGRIAPKFFPETELARLRDRLQRQPVLTLACWRSVPVLAETSVILAAAAGVPVGRIFCMTLVPNFVVATIYSLAADESFATACVAFASTLAASSLLWCFMRKRGGREGDSPR